MIVQILIDIEDEDELWKDNGLNYGKIMVCVRDIFLKGNSIS